MLNNTDVRNLFHHRMTVLRRTAIRLKSFLGPRSVVFLLLPLILVLASCKDEGAGTVIEDPSGRVISITGCKGNSFKPAEGPASESCLVHMYDADKRTLTLKHVNAGFNCCPDNITAIVTIEGGIITIDERESNSPCDCECLYDVDIVISNLDEAEYLIRLVEPYRRTSDPPFEVTANLASEPIGSSCVDRLYYPWGS